MENLKRELRKLNSTQLNEVIKYANGLLLFPAAGRTAVEGKASWVLQVLERECEGLAIGHAAYNERVRRSVNKAAHELEEYFEGAMPGSSLIERRLVLATGIRLLYERMAAQGLAPTPPLLANQLSNVPAVLDRAFPGYARLGFLGSVVNAGDEVTAPAGRVRKRAHSAVSQSRARSARKRSRRAA